MGAPVGRLQFNLEVASTLSVFSKLKAQDSDWEDINNPGQKTTFSDAQARPRCWTFDGNIVGPLTDNSRIRWLAGYRVQQFRFTYTNMLQREIFEAGVGLLSRAILFRARSRHRI